MCGRYALFTLSPEIIREILGFVPMDEHGLIIPRWNIAPTQRAPVVRVAEDGRRSLDALRWGLVPSWADDLRFGAKAVNARVETAATKPAFRSAWKARRCLVPASGFYEWEQTKPKRAWFFRPPDDDEMLFAGLWESRTDKATGEIVETYAILTRPAYSIVAPIHNRSPLALPADWRDAWLRGDVRDAADLLAAPEPDVVAVPVGADVNNARAEGPGLVEPRRA